ncbi:hypothetical protein LTR27_004457 [Elasticomyces elasticus]|nr:hypothetical protein LTR27_004457 [Elasticomyces elasticus]
MPRFGLRPVNLKTAIKARMEVMKARVDGLLHRTKTETSKSDETFELQQRQTCEAAQTDVDSSPSSCQPNLTEVADPSARDPIDQPWHPDISEREQDESSLFGTSSVPMTVSLPPQLDAISENDGDGDDSVHEVLGADACQLLSIWDVRPKSIHGADDDASAHDGEEFRGRRRERVLVRKAKKRVGPRVRSPARKEPTMSETAMDGPHLDFASSNETVSSEQTMVSLQQLDPVAIPS